MTGPLGAYVAHSFKFGELLVNGSACSLPGGYRGLGRPQSLWVCNIPPPTPTLLPPSRCPWPVSTQRYSEWGEGRSHVLLALLRASGSGQGGGAWVGRLRMNDQLA